MRALPTCASRVSGRQQSRPPSHRGCHGRSWAALTLGVYPGKSKNQPGGRRYKPVLAAREHPRSSKPAVHVTARSSALPAWQPQPTDLTAPKCKLKPGKSQNQPGGCLHEPLLAVRTPPRSGKAAFTSMSCAHQPPVDFPLSCWASPRQSWRVEASALACKGVDRCVACAAASVSGLSLIHI